MSGGVAALGVKAAGLGANLLGPWRLYAELAVVASLLGAIGWQTAHRWAAEANAAETRADLQTYKANVADTARRATETNRAEESRREAAQKDVADEAQRMASRARRDAADGLDSHNRLLDRAAAVASGGGASGNPASAAGGAPTSGAGLVLANVLGRADARAGELAAAYDEARTAGLACERSYDSLRAPLEGS